MLNTFFFKEIIYFLFIFTMSTAIIGNFVKSFIHIYLLEFGVKNGYDLFRHSLFTRGTRLFGKYMLVPTPPRVCSSKYFPVRVFFTLLRLNQLGGLVFVGEWAAFGKMYQKYVKNNKVFLFVNITERLKTSARNVQND